MFLSKKTPLVAVDIGSHSVKVAQLNQTRTGYELQSFGLLPLKPNSIEDGIIKDTESVIETIASLVKAEKISTRFAIGSVSGESIIIRQIRMPMMSREKINEFILKDAEKYIPLNIDDVIIDFQILGYKYFQFFLA